MNDIKNWLKNRDMPHKSYCPVIITDSGFSVADWFITSSVPPGSQCVGEFWCDEDTDELHVELYGK